MLLIYRKADGRVMNGPNTNSAFPEGGPADQAVAEVIQWAGGSPADYGELRFNDEVDREAVARAFAAATLEVKDGQLVTYDRMTVASPIEATAGVPVEVAAELPADTPDTEVTFELAGEGVVEPVAAGVVSHLYQFADAGVYLVTVSSSHHGSAAVEVIVQ